MVQTITAIAAGSRDRRSARRPTGSPLLACRRVTYDRHGDAVIVAEHRYAAHLTALEVEFPCTQTPGARHG